MTHFSLKNLLLAASLSAALMTGAPARAQSEASLVLSALPVASVVGTASAAAGSAAAGAVGLSALPVALAVSGAMLVVKAVEVSVTILTPEGSKELRSLQMVNDNQKIPDTDFKRIVYQHGRNAEELGLMKKQGMSDREVLASATTVAAKVLGMDSQIGRLAPGYSADIIAVDGNPLADVTVLEEVDFVMVRGRVIE